MASIVCWRSGEAAVVSRPPKGSIAVMTGPARRLQRILEVVARHAYDGRTLLVPGIPEAATDDEAIEAVFSFQTQLERRIRPEHAR